MTLSKEALLQALGFRFGINGTHAARTVMLDDLRLLLAHVPADAVRADYASAIVEANVLAKPTRKSRELALRHLSALYALDPSNTIFRAMRRLWAFSESAQPLLALGVALARDPLLRRSRAFVLNRPPGSPIAREETEAWLAAAYPDRFSPASLKSFSQNVLGSWTAAGLLQGKVKKTRVLPSPSPEAAALLLFLGYLEGRTGQRLFSSDWMELFGGSPDELEALSQSASHRGLLVFMNAGGVKEIRFPGFLTPEEERMRQEVSHVV